MVVRTRESEGEQVGGSGGGPQPAKLLGAMLTLPTIESSWGDGRLGEGEVEGSALAGGDGEEGTVEDGGEKASETHAHLPAKRLRGDMAAQGGHEGEGTRSEGVKGAEGALHGAYEMRESIGQGKFGEVVVLGRACFVSPFTPRLELNRNIWLLFHFIFFVGKALHLAIQIIFSKIPLAITRQTATCSAQHPHCFIWQVWKARVYGQKDSQEGYVLKRLFVEKGHAVLLSG